MDRKYDQTLWASSASGSLVKTSDPLSEVDQKLVRAGALDDCRAAQSYDPLRGLRQLIVVDTQKTGNA